MKHLVTRTSLLCIALLNVKIQCAHVAEQTRSWNARIDAHTKEAARGIVRQKRKKTAAPLKQTPLPLPPTPTRPVITKQPIPPLPPLPARAAQQAENIPNAPPLNLSQDSALQLPQAPKDFKVKKTPQQLAREKAEQQRQHEEQLASIMRKQREALGEVDHGDSDDSDDNDDFDTIILSTDKAEEEQEEAEEQEEKKAPKPALNKDALKGLLKKAEEKVGPGKRQTVSESAPASWETD